jgi:hypothetical protein
MMSNMSVLLNGTAMLRKTVALVASPDIHLDQPLWAMTADARRVAADVRLTA